MQTQTQLKGLCLMVRFALTRLTVLAQIRAALVFALMVLMVLATQLMNAQTLTVLYNFTGTHGDGNLEGGSRARLLLDAAGNIYGTTPYGGSVTKCGNCGTAFKLDTAGNETVLHTFGGIGDGAIPEAGLVQDGAGNLYGTTGYGGASNFGTVFKLDPTTRKETVLYSFTGTDGAYPFGELVRDGVGNFYGTTFGGGTSNACYGTGCGTVFKLDATGKETVLHSFAGGADGANPTEGLVQDAAGNLYGTTENGGASNLGTVFKLDTTGTETVLYSFIGGADGAYPDASLIQDEVGNLYGTTIYGGGSSACLGGDTCGTVFKVDTAGTETVLHGFNRLDGWNPAAGLVRDAVGNLYGTTLQGGAIKNGTASGTVFRVGEAGTETVLYTFHDLIGDPASVLLLDAAGNLYGTAGGGMSRAGVVFKLTTSKSATSTSFASSLNPSTYGQSITWTATVTSSGSITPTGKVNFTWSGHTIGAATLNSSGVATLTKSNLNADAYPLTAVYAGDAANLRSTSAVLNQVVLETTSAATLTSSPNPSAQGQAVTFTATLTSPTVKPTGPVTFTAGKTVLGTAQLSAGKATLTTSSLPAGTNTVTVTYQGDSNIAKSTASVTQVVQ